MASRRPRPHLALAVLALSPVLAACIPQPPAPGSVAREDVGHVPRPVRGDAAGSLLISHKKREQATDEKRATWTLTYSARALVNDFLGGIANDDPYWMAQNLSAEARWGYPDRRETGSVPIRTQDDRLGLEMMEGIQSVAVRLDAKAKWTCPPMPDGHSLYITVGAEPYWCWYEGKDALDFMIFKMIIEDGEPKIDYIGAFGERPATLPGALYRRKDPAPPTTPLPKVSPKRDGEVPGGLDQAALQEMAAKRAAAIKASREGAPGSP